MPCLWQKNVKISSADSPFFRSLTISFNSSRCSLSRLLTFSVITHPAFRKIVLSQIEVNDCLTKTFRNKTNQLLAKSFVYRQRFRFSTGLELVLSVNGPMSILKRNQGQSTMFCDVLRLFAIIPATDSSYAIEEQLETS